MDMLIEHCLGHYQQNIAELDEKSSVSALIDDMFVGEENNGEEVEEKVTVKYEILSEMELDEMDTISVIDTAEEYLDEKIEALNSSKEEPDDEEGMEKEIDENQADEEECMLELDQSEDEDNDGEDSKTSMFVRNFMSIKLNVTTIIAAYKKQPYLWNSNNPPEVRAKERPKCLQKIADEIKDRINVQVTSKEVAAIIARLRHDYRERLKRANEFGAENNKIKNTRSWFYEQMDFLQPYIENCSIFNLDSSQPPLEIEQIIHIFGIYKRLPVLWNSELIENVCTNKRSEALSQMQKLIDNEMGIKVNINNIRRYLHTIHAFFTKEKRNSTNSFRTTKERFDLYKHLVFLTDHVGPFKCTDCNRSFLSPLNWKVHVAEHDGTIPLTCSLCKKEYKTTDAYMAHARRHMNDLSRPADLEIHSRCHTGSKPYCCEICGASYRHSQAFKTHKRRHQKQYLHHCPVCSKGFYKKDQLNNHLRTHTDIRDIKCDVCGKGFKTKKTMLQHKLTHEEGRNHMCPYCDKTFKNKLGLAQHVKIHRKNEMIELEINSS
ncbi:zinc finger protein 112-like [Musca vetustissima]|uniref:zinc finger protein 112-like n=1 Tax=Musca vetustissima TaxID=27455 RepID=UPI002AB6880E|nr:zinc finger protein 112-like [Musca vetustissima]